MLDLLLANKLARAVEPGAHLLLAVAVAVAVDVDAAAQLTVDVVPNRPGSASTRAATFRCSP